VRYGIISDIHSNLTALERVLEFLKRSKVDRYLCLGDIVGYGARPNECCQLVRELDVVAVRGNHDEAMWYPAKDKWFIPAARSCIAWTREVLTSDNRDFLATLPRVVSVDNIEICHGSLTDPDAYIDHPLIAAASIAIMRYQICFFGHTHCAEWFVQHEAGGLPARYDASGGSSFAIETNCKYMVNPGAVGQPRDHNSQASCAIYDTKQQVIRIERIEYDVEMAQRQIIEAGLPEQMASRLVLGV